MNTIVCNYCGKDVEISTAITSQIQNQVLEEERKRHQDEMTKMLRDTQEKAEKKIKEEFSFQIENSRKEATEMKERTDKLMQDLLKANEEARLMKQREEEREIEMQKKLASERERLSEEIGKSEREKVNLEKMELQKQLDDTKKALEDAQRKAAQKSQQLQGEVLELEIETMLKNTFPQDEIIPVGKGVSGADICQIVKSPRGFICGKILWEFKRTQSWSDKWIAKLKEDMRVEKADIAVIVSLDLPDEAKNGIGNKEGVVISGHDFIIPVAMMLRKNLLDVGFEKAKSINKGEKAEVVFTYITSREFQQQVENIVDAYREIHGQILKERTAFEKIWKQREVQAQRIITSTANIFGTLQGTAGASMPQIKGLDLIEDGEEQLDLLG